MPTSIAADPPLPTPLPPPPRRVRADTPLAPNLFGKLFILPHVLVGICAPFGCLFLILAALFSTTVPGQVINTRVGTSSKGRTTYYVDFRYADNGQSVEHTTPIPFDLYQDLTPHTAPTIAPRKRRRAAATAAAALQLPAPPPKTLAIRYFRLGPFRQTSLVATENPWAAPAFLFFWTAFWDGILSVFVWMLWIRPLRIRGLYKHGLVAPGVIIAKRMVSGRKSANRYSLTFLYEEPATHQKTTVEADVPNRAAWQRAADGEVVTILYDPRHPKRAAIYEYSGYHILPARTS